MADKRTAFKASFLRLLKMGMNHKVTTIPKESNNHYTYWKEATISTCVTIRKENKKPININRSQSKATTSATSNNLIQSLKTYIPYAAHDCENV